MRRSLFRRRKEGRAVENEGRRGQETKRLRDWRTEIGFQRVRGREGINEMPKS
jgi:hypothetical protein